MLFVAAPDILDVGAASHTSDTDPEDPSMVNPPREDRLDAKSPLDSTEALLWVHDELIRIERHWTDQVQNQQRRIAAILAVNGFLLAFLATAGLQITTRRITGWYLYPFYSCLVLLAAALVFGVLTLFPQIPISGSKADRKSVRGDRKEWLRSTFFPPPPGPMDFWLDSGKVWEAFTRLPDRNMDALLLQSCESIAANANGNLTHNRVQVRRRKWMNWQIGFIMLSLILLIVAVVGWAVHIL
ncbi:MAG TPA: hypothetical protein VN781_03595 [Acidimicrobiales bacterium]|nr:hypothetical protein [Acidimicrobiales bacterium]